MAKHEKTPTKQRRNRLECRACGVICERVVYPVHCLRGRCRYVYAFEEEGSTFFGCVVKVFSAELDLAPHRAAPRSDPYGALRVVHAPRENCHVRVERAYQFLFERDGCRNPAFAWEAAEFSAEAVRLIVDGRDEDAPPLGGVDDSPVTDPTCPSTS
jgi:hypothetical protein